MAVVVSGTFSPSPAARACSDLKADVARYVGATNAARALSEAEIYIGTAVAKLNTERWHWTLVYQDITLVADQVDYDLAAAFGSPRHAYLLDADGNISGAIGFDNPKTFSIQYDSTSESGNATSYTAYNVHEYGTMSLDVPPSAQFISQYPTIRLWYYQKIQPCGGSTTALDVPHEVADWVAWYAKSLMAANHDPAKFAMADQVQRDLWRQLRKENMEVQTSDWS